MSRWACIHLVPIEWCLKGRNMWHVKTHSDKINKPSPAARLFEIISSYPVLLVLLLVLGIGIHVGAHAGVAGRAVDAADAVGGMLPPDTQVRLLILVILLATITAGCGNVMQVLLGYFYLLSRHLCKIFKCLRPGKFVQSILKYMPT